jgi:hypothetical protein
MHDEFHQILQQRQTQYCGAGGSVCRDAPNSTMAQASNGTLSSCAQVLAGNMCRDYYLDLCPGACQVACTTATCMKSEEAEMAFSALRKMAWTPASATPQPGFEDTMFHKFHNIKSGCIRVCPLALPSVEQVEKCKIGLGKYSGSCLQNTAECPNCDRLNLVMPFSQNVQVWQNDTRVSLDKVLPRGTLYGFKPAPLEAWLLGNDPDRNMDVSSAEIYVQFKKVGGAKKLLPDLLTCGSTLPPFVNQVYDDHELPAEFNWDHGGSAFFAATVLSTVGYGRPFYL